ncbi:hypothetical protein [Rhizobium leguminosarum]|uniref:hypothetical protein n=1 Tax=Rhizobium leguminosarum TaxID=384 RepID=UPI003D05F14B
MACTQLEDAGRTRELDRVGTYRSGKIRNCILIDWRGVGLGIWFGARWLRLQPAKAESGRLYLSAKRLDHRTVSANDCPHQIAVDRCAKITHACSGVNVSAKHAGKRGRYPSTGDILKREQASELRGGLASGRRDGSESMKIRRSTTFDGFRLPIAHQPEIGDVFYRPAGAGTLEFECYKTAPFRRAAESQAVFYVPHIDDAR